MVGVTGLEPMASWSRRSRSLSGYTRSGRINTHFFSTHRKTVQYHYCKRKGTRREIRYSRFSSIYIRLVRESAKKQHHAK